MLNVTLGDILARPTRVRFDEDCIYVFPGDNDAALYVGKSNHPINRIKQHIQKRDPLGLAIRDALPDAAIWPVELWPLGECIDLMLQTAIVGRFKGYAIVQFVRGKYRPLSNDWGMAEWTMIDRYRPILNLNPRSSTNPDMQTRWLQDVQPLTATLYRQLQQTRGRM